MFLLWVSFFVQLYYKVCCEHDKPSVPKNMPADYATLMQRCWDDDPELRPTAEWAFFFYFFCSFPVWAVAQTLKQGMIILRMRLGYTDNCEVSTALELLLLSLTSERTYNDNPDSCDEISCWQDDSEVSSTPQVWHA